MSHIVTTKISIENPDVFRRALSNLGITMDETMQTHAFYGSLRSHGFRINVDGFGYPVVLSDDNRAKDHAYRLAYDTYRATDTAENCRKTIHKLEHVYAAQKAYEDLSASGVSCFLGATAEVDGELTTEIFQN